MDIEDYRAAKYIISLSKAKKNTNNKFIPQMETYLKSSFMNLWIDNLIFSSLSMEPELLKMQIATDIIAMSEKEMNMLTVGVIGGPKLPKDISQRVRIITEEFEDFISKSKYTKTTIVKNLTSCPTIIECQIGDKSNCGLFDHGYTRKSFHDLT